jgi:hypothetical protein
MSIPLGVVASVELLPNEWSISAVTFGGLGGGALPAPRPPQDVRNVQTKPAAIRRGAVGDLCQLMSAIERSQFSDHSQPLCARLRSCAEQLNDGSIVAVLTRSPPRMGGCQIPRRLEVPTNAAYRQYGRSEVDAAAGPVLCRVECRLFCF